MSHHHSYSVPGYYPLNVQVDDDYSYAHSQSRGHDRLYATQTHAPSRAERRSSVRHVSHAVAAPEMYTGRHSQSSFVDVSPMDTRFYNHYQPQYITQGHTYVNPQPQVVARSPPSYEMSLGEDHYPPAYEMIVSDDKYSYSSGTNVIVDSSDESSSSPSSRSYDRRQHHGHRYTKSGSKRFYCDFEDCIDKDTGKRRSLGRKADLKRHMLTVHGKPQYDCPMPKCARIGDDGFCRKDHMNEHLRTYHNREVVTGKSKGRKHS